ncbi:MAG TPA: MarR family transcriptional regulator [Longimicrobiales bacterium]|nr:MarR family transcriptional regulator [Longimicrobiales bacterium]
MTSQLRDEIQQTRPFESREHEAFLALIRTAALLADSLEKVLRPAGVTTAQYNVLRILRGSEEGLCRNEVRDRMLTRMPDMTRLLDRMEQAGLVSRTRSTEDRRVVSTHITEAGRAVLDKLAGPVSDEHERRLGHLGTERLDALVTLLAQIRETLPE